MQSRLVEARRLLMVDDSGMGEAYCGTSLKFGNQRPTKR